MFARGDSVRLTLHFLQKRGRLEPVSRSSPLVCRAKLSNSSSPACRTQSLLRRVQDSDAASYVAYHGLSPMFFHQLSAGQQLCKPVDEMQLSGVSLMLLDNLLLLHHHLEARPDRVQYPFHKGNQLDTLSQYHASSLEYLGE